MGAVAQSWAVTVDNFDPRAGLLCSSHNHQKVQLPGVK